MQGRLAPGSSAASRSAPREICDQVAFFLGLCDRRMLQIAEMPVAYRRVGLRGSAEALELFRKDDRRIGNLLLQKSAETQFPPRSAMR